MSTTKLSLPPPPPPIIISQFSTLNNEEINSKMYLKKPLYLPNTSLTIPKMTLKTPPTTIKFNLLNIENFNLTNSTNNNSKRFLSGENQQKQRQQKNKQKIIPHATVNMDLIMVGVFLYYYIDVTT